MAVKKNQKMLKVAGYSTFFGVLFVAFLIWKFPVERFVPQIEAKLQEALDREVSVGDMYMSLTGDLVLTSVEIEAVMDEEDQAAQAKEPGGDEAEGGDQKESRVPRLSYLIDEVEIDVGFVSWLLGELDLGLSMSVLGGSMNVEYQGPIPKNKDRKARGGGEASAKSDGEAEPSDAVPVAFRMEVEDIPLKRVHFLRSALPVPIEGTLDFKAKVESNTGKFADGSGEIELAMNGLIFSKEGFETRVFDMSMGVPALVVESLLLKIELEKGEGVVTRFDVKSKHIDMGVDGVITLKDPFSESQADLYITFKLLDAYINMSEALKTIMGNVDTFSSTMKRAHRDDDFYGFRYRGVIGKGRFTPTKIYTSPRRKATSARQSKGRGASKRKSTRRAPRSRASEGAASKQPDVAPGRDRMPVAPSPKVLATPPGTPGAGMPRGGMHTLPERETARPEMAVERYERPMHEPQAEEVAEEEVQEEEVHEEVAEEEVEEEVAEEEEEVEEEVAEEEEAPEEEESENGEDEEDESGGKVEEPGDEEPGAEEPGDEEPSE